MKLEDIGFYTLTNHRANNASSRSPMWRCEIIITNKCNFDCIYCRGNNWDKMAVEDIHKTIEIWGRDNLKNIRFSGGEPTLCPELIPYIRHCKDLSVDRIAISTNGSADYLYYESLIEEGVNDISISFDSCCESTFAKMTGKNGYYDKIADNISRLSKICYVTAGLVITEDNIDNFTDAVCFLSGSGIADIRIIPAAQFGRRIKSSAILSKDILNKHPILKYRYKNMQRDFPIRGISESDSRKCHLVKDDSCVAGDKHFPCVIHMRENGEPIGDVGQNMRGERLEWFDEHNSFEDDICRNNCLDVCVAYNNMVDKRFKKRDKESE